MTDFAALVAEFKDAALDAGATWACCTSEYQAKLQERLQAAERALLAAAPPKPAVAASGSYIVSARLIPWEPGQQGVAITLSCGRQVAIPLAQDAVAAGGSGDLAALSAQATAGVWSDETVYNSAFEDRDRSSRALRQQRKADRSFLVALVNAYRSGRLIETPTADPVAQGEPVAWAYEWRQSELGKWRRAATERKLTASKNLRNIRPLYEAPVAPRSDTPPKPAVTVEEIADILADLSDAKPHVLHSFAEAILALFSAPRAGAETVQQDSEGATDV